MPGDDILRVRAPTNKSAISSSLEFATASPVILCGVRFYPIFARERAADSLQRKTGFYSFIAAYRVFTGSWLAGWPARDTGLLRCELWDSWLEAARQTCAFRSFSLSEKQTSSVDENDERNDKETSSRSGNLAQRDKGSARFYEASPRAILSCLVNSLRETNEGRVEKRNKGVLKLR
ncbi:hypothetical protein G5I_01726 [Acromyrmex echinatior]|uniref:Uncharacterized protein n=1 Tax=Acromyrmex echinatior TaxID=103372 RepID=F4W8E5_ACREC|nr:hypothetical protein G5I_01726 [Acromyrmex echinatior]